MESVKTCSHGHSQELEAILMSQRSNRKAKMMEQLRRRGYNPPGSPYAKSIPLGYDFGCVVARQGENVAQERVEK